MDGGGMGQVDLSSLVRFFSTCCRAQAIPTTAEFNIHRWTRVLIEVYSILRLPMLSGEFRSCHVNSAWRAFSKLDILRPTPMTLTSDPAPHRPAVDSTAP
jgi:hypothetical protein